MRSRSANASRLSAFRAPAAALVMLVVLIVVFAACGDDGGGDVTKTATDGKITVVARDISFDVDTIEAKPGELEVTLVEEGALEHTFKINGQDGELKVDSGSDRDTGTWDLDPGDYEFECTIAGHASQGMKGKIVVAQ
jgi:plastocyanin